MPYTLGLLGSIPRLDAEEKQPLVPIEGQPPSLVALPPGCTFAPRCPLAIDACREAEPPLVAVDGTGEHTAACIRTDEVARSDADAVEIFGVEVPAESPLAAVPRERREVVLAVSDLQRHFPVTRGTVFRRRVGTVHAVDGVSFDVRQGETLALVGESGCGKTTTLMEILGLDVPQTGGIQVLGRDVATLDRRARKAVRRDLQVVFQDPMASLDPRMPVSDILAEPLSTHGVDAATIRRRVPELLDLVGLRHDHASRYPAQFSGGQRQRIGIARALALEPKIIVLDEPVSALDVSIQAGVINLLDELKARLGLAYLFVAHDLSVVRHIADRVAVMYLGKIVEIGSVADVFHAPQHPYTQALLSAIPIPDPAKERQRERILLIGDLPTPTDPPSGCRFRTRCFRYASLSPEDQVVCREVEPPLEQAGRGADQQSACHYAEEREIV